jgi:hypothetical protein
MAPMCECNPQRIVFQNLFGEQVVHTIKQSEDETVWELDEEWRLHEFGPAYSMDSVISKDSPLGNTQDIACHGNGKCSIIQRSMKATTLVQSGDCFEGYFLLFVHVSHGNTGFSLSFSPNGLTVPINDYEQYFHAWKQCQWHVVVSI